ncbi:hypothetical protein Tco_0685008 [Tanacetum coccineum]
MSGSQDEIPPPPPPPSTQTPTQQTPHTVSTIKLPILKKGEYDIWAMKMEHYLAHTDYLIWEVIQNGNGPVSITTDTQGQIKVLPPRTAEEILARERERKARTTLLMALPEDHLAKFHKMTDAKEMWDAIKSRLGRNDESKKMQKYILKQQFEGFSVSNLEGLHKGCDRFQSLLSQFEIHEAGVDSLSFDDLYNNLKVFENDVKGSTVSPSSMQNVAFVSQNTISTNDEDSKALVTIDGEGVDWTSHSKEEDDYALMACNSSGSDTEVTSYSNECKESYAKLKKLYDAQREQLSDASIEIKAYTQGLKKVEAQLVAHQQGQLWYEEKIRFMKIDLGDKTDVLTYHKKQLTEAQKEKEDLKAKVEKWHNSSKNLVLQSVFMSKESELENQPLYDRFVTAEGMHAVPPPMTGNYIPSRPDVEIDYSQFTYGSKQYQTTESATQTSDFDTCESDCSVKTQEPLPKPTVNEPKVVTQPKVWSDAPIIEEYESDSEDAHVSLPIEEQETPIILTKISTVRHNFNSQAILTNTARNISTVKPVVNRVRTKTVFHKTHSPFSRPFNKTTALRTKFSYQKVNTDEVNAVSAVGGKRETAVKPSAGLSTQNFTDKGIVDSGCSRHMTGNKAYVAEYQDFNGGPVAFGGCKGYITGKGNFEKEAESAQDYFVLPIWSSYSSTVKRSTAKDAGEAPNKHPDLKEDENQ